MEGTRVPRTFEVLPKTVVLVVRLMNHPRPVDSGVSPTSYRSCHDLSEVREDVPWLRVDFTPPLLRDSPHRRRIPGSSVAVPQSPLRSLHPPVLRQEPPRGLVEEVYWESRLHWTVTERPRRLRTGTERDFGSVGTSPSSLTSATHTSTSPSSPSTSTLSTRGPLRPSVVRGREVPYKESSTQARVERPGEEQCRVGPWDGT